MWPSKGAVRAVVALALAVGVVTSCTTNNGGAVPVPSGTTGSSGAPTTTQTPRSGGTLRLALANDAHILSIDTINATSSGYSVANNIYDSLYQSMPDGSVAPGLAEKTDVSSDGRTVTLTLRGGVKFHDGTDFDANAVKINIEVRQKSPKFLVRGQIAPITQIRVVDSKTVQFVLSTPTPALQVILSSPAFGMQSPTAMEKYQGATYRDHAAGTGPFKLDAPPAPTRVEIVRNDEYWGKKAYLDKVVFTVIRDLSARVAALEAGDIDVAEALRASPEHDRLVKEGRVLVQTDSVASQLVYIWFNNAKGPFTDKRVRLATVQGLNTASYPATYYGLGESADSVVAPALQGYAPSKPYTYDPSKAKQAIADGGIPAGTPLRLLILNPENAALAQLVKQDLDKLGFQTALQQLDTTAWLQAMSVPGPESSGWQVAVGGAGYPYSDAEAPLFRTFLSTNDAPKGSNLTHYLNPQVDALLNKQASTVDPAARKALLAQVQQIIWDDAPLYPLLRFRNARVTSRSVHDLESVSRSEPYLVRTWLSQ